MKLNLNDDRSVEQPTAEHIRAAFDDLAADQFLILSRTDDDYVQTYLEQSGELVLEYRESEDAHYSATGDRLSKSQVAALFLAYSQGHGDWNAGLTWERLHFEDDFQGELHEGNAFLIEGEEYARIPVGAGVADADVAVCPACQAAAGELHGESCVREECPRCHARLRDCPCE